jgi:preprotein translocase subunit SecG
MFLTFLTIAIAIVAFALIIAVLIQNPKGGGIDSAYGSGANQMFGAAKSADMIERWTWYLGAILLFLCLASFFAISSKGGTLKIN